MCLVQLEDPAIRWQMALYRDLPNHYEDTSNPEKTVERVLDIAHVLFHLDQVCVCVCVGGHAVVSVGGFMNHPQRWEGPFW